MSTQPESGYALEIPEFTIGDRGEVAIAKRVPLPRLVLSGGPELREKLRWLINAGGTFRVSVYIWIPSGSAS
jgi:hypothetical protein